MEPYRFRASRVLQDFVRGFHPDLKRRIRVGLDRIRADPMVGKPLHDELKGLRSLRVARLRIIYRVGPRRVIDLVAIGPRRSVYEATLRALHKD